ncbi:MAG: hypothetical protein LUP97_09025 [Methanoregula sp.]|nr:hypothetical protein [Methanoregula sp.]
MPEHPGLTCSGRGKNFGYSLTRIREIFSIHNFTIGGGGRIRQKGYGFVILIPHGPFRPSEKCVAGNPFKG